MVEDRSSKATAPPLSFYMKGFTCFAMVVLCCAGSSRILHKENCKPDGGLIRGFEGVLIHQHLALAC